ncbi:hypothetical protein HWV62_4946 [Athelia sp. TMB]|nr:hypothetical protein HWV62_4946 [Athelia sp. TMB]
MVSGWSGSSDTPLGLGSVYALAAPFITAFPSSNHALPVEMFPTPTSTATAERGSTVSITSDEGNSSGTLCTAFYTGLSTEFADLERHGHHPQRPHRHRLCGRHHLRYLLERR